LGYNQCTCLLLLFKNENVALDRTLNNIARNYSWVQHCEWAMSVGLKGICYIEGWNCKILHFLPQNPYLNKVHMNISWPIHRHCTIQTRAKPQHWILWASSACKHNHFAWHPAINSNTKELQALINTREHWAWGLATDFNSLESEWAWIYLHRFTTKSWPAWNLRFVVGTQGQKRCSIYFWDCNTISISLTQVDQLELQYKLNPSVHLCECGLNAVVSYPWETYIFLKWSCLCKRCGTQQNMLLWNYIVILHLCISSFKSVSMWKETSKF
jgi:hypothetical protein